MGIFQSRPEEPSEWAGLPAEPWEPRVPGEVLPPDAGDLGILSPAGISLSVPTEYTTIEIDVEAPTPDDQTEPDDQTGSDRE